MAPLSIADAVAAACLSLPGTDSKSSHGMPTFRVAGRSFASWALSHHGDGIAALWLKMPPGAQDLFVTTEPEHYFVPPYSGPRGWLALRLNDLPDGGPAWTAVCERIVEAYLHVAPVALTARGVPAIEPPAPNTPLLPHELDPWLVPEASAVLRQVRDICTAWPEVSETLQFGSPAWKAGKKTFCTAHWKEHGPLSFWVGTEHQIMLTLDSRFRILAYTGNNGWMALDLAHGVVWDEVADLMLGSYRHFALKRMLKVLES